MLLGRPMAFNVPTYRDIEKLVDEYVNAHGYKEYFASPTSSPDGTTGRQEDQHGVIIGLSEEDMPGLVSHISSALNGRSNDNLYFLDSNLNREFIGLKSILDKMSSGSAVLFLKAVKLLAAASLKGTSKDVSL
jgi:hypothetical protein